MITTSMSQKILFRNFCDHNLKVSLKAGSYRRFVKASLKNVQSIASFVQAGGTVPTLTSRMQAILEYVKKHGEHDADQMQATLGIRKELFEDSLKNIADILKGHRVNKKPSK